MRARLRRVVQIREDDRVDEDGTADQVWTDTTFPPHRDLAELAAYYNREYRLVAVLSQTGSKEKV